MIVEKSCDTCKFDNGSLSVEAHQYPCRECNNYNKYEEYIGENLYDMKQYPIERETFEILFCDIDNMLFGEGINELETDNFKYWRYIDEFYILHKDSGTLVNWYKHVGRCNTCNKKLSFDEYKKFVKDFEEELKEF